MHTVYAKNNVWLYHGDNVEFMRTVPEGVVDLTVTSPPYDDLRKYTEESAWTFDKFKEVAKELFRITKEGGVVVWNVNDATINGGESLTSFKQAIFFVEDVGFKLHDTMIWQKSAFSAVGALKTRYAPVFEFMFIMVKGKLSTFNPLKDRPNKHAGVKLHGTVRQRDGSTKQVFGTKENKEIAQFGQRFNIWQINEEKQSKKYGHPAVFPLALASDHIRSWSNEGDLVFDPFMGSGTVAVAATKLNRRVMGCEIAKEYVDIQIARLEKEV